MQTSTGHHWVRRTVALGVGALLLILPAGVLGRDYKLGASRAPAELLQSVPAAPVYRDFLPQAVDLSRYMPAVGDQGNQGSCVGWATAYAARAYYAYQVEHRDISQPQNIPSPAYIFNMIHIGKTCDEGSYIPDALQVLVNGAYSLADFPYDDTKCPVPLPPVRARASDFKIDGFEQVWNIQQGGELDQVKGALARGNPVVIIASLDKGFFDLSPRNKVWRSDAGQSDEGGHAVTIVGYDDASQTFKFINQWSTAWGDAGYGRMTYDTFRSRVYEGYVIKMPGDPEVALAPEDFTTDAVVPEAPATPLFVPPLNVRPTEAARALDSEAVTLPPLACGRVDLTTAEDGTSVAIGFVGSEGDLAKVNDALAGKVEDNRVELAPWPACEVRLTLAAALADSDPPQAVVDPVSPRVGDEVRVGLRAPGYPSYLYAAWFAADGTVNLLTQPTSRNLRPNAPHAQMTFGDMNAGEIGLKVAPPVGSEMLLVLASETPLFASAQPDLQAERPFLSSLRQAILGGASGRVTATLVPVTTGE